MHVVYSVSYRRLNSQIRLRLFLILLLLLGLGSENMEIVAASAKIEQANKNVPIKGVVLDESGESLIGVSVVVKGKTIGSVTDVDGRFEMSIPPSSTLVFSYIGYKTIEIPVGKRNEMRVVMKADQLQLDEVVVVAYGQQKKVTVTGAVASIGSKDLIKSPSPNMATTLAGRLPGLTVIQTSGEPGRDDVAMYLRGAATSNGTTPLFLVDGVPVESISNINPYEIESLSVLKDASATAVFGVRGANGVILVTTKRGEKGKVNINVSAQYSVQKFAFDPDRVDSWTYAELRNEAAYNENPVAGKYQIYTQDDIDKYASWKTGNPVDPFWYPNNNWMNILFRDYAPMTNANMNISGGNEKIRYFVNLGYLHQGGMFNTESEKKLGYDPQSKLDRYNFRSNLDYTFNKYIKAFVNMSGSVDRVNGTRGDMEIIMAGALSHRPTAPGPVAVEGLQLLMPDGSIGSPNTGLYIHEPGDPLMPAYPLLNRIGYILETKATARAAAGIEVDLSWLLKGLSTKAQFSFDTQARTRVIGAKGYREYAYIRQNDGSFVLTNPHDDDMDGKIGYGKDAASKYFLNMQWQLNYNRLFNEKHGVTGLLLFQRDLREASQIDGVSDPYLPFNVLGIAARGTYAYDERYLAEVNLGYNGSEQFAKGKRFGFFPAFSLGWVVSNERFMKENDILTNLKFRFSYGQVGNDQIGAKRFLYLDDITAGGSNDKFLIHIPSLNNGGKIFENYIGNKNLTWEVAYKQNYGVDLSLFKALSFSFDYFMEDRDKILITRKTTPTLQGLPLSAIPKMNMGKIENKGFEAELSYNKMFTSDYGVNIRLNYCYNKNKVIFADEPTLAEDYAYRYRNTGFMLGQNFGYIIDKSVDPATGRDGSGFFNSKEDIANSGLIYEIGLPLAGDFIYVDQNKDGKINDKDKVPVGYSGKLPQITYGASFNFQLKDFDISILLQGVGRYSKYYSDNGVFEENMAKSYYDMHLNRWSEERYAAGEKITHPRLVNGSSTSHTANSYYIMNSAYFRLKNAEIGYTLPKRISKHIGSDKVRFYVNGNNLLTKQHLKMKIYDPEQADPLRYPLTRTFNVGVNINF